MMNLEMMIISNCYGVKASKVKARKSRKARRMEKSHRLTKWQKWESYDKYCLHQAVQKTEKHLHNQMLAEQADAEAEYAEYLATEKAEAEAKAERIRIALMSEEEKKTKRNLLKNALIKEGMGLDSLFTTERGTFFFETLVEYAGDYFEPYTKTVGKALFKYIEGKPRCRAEQIYVLWQEGDWYEGKDAIVPRSVEEMIEDMVKII